MHLCPQLLRRLRCFMAARSRLPWAMIVPLNSSLGSRARIYLKKKEKEKENESQVWWVAHTCNSITLGGQVEQIT